MPTPVIASDSEAISPHNRFAPGNDILRPLRNPEQLKTFDALVLKTPMYKEELNEYLNKPVVVDTATSLVYIGTLSQIGNSFITLKDVDVHDVDEGASSKAVYALEAKKHGIMKNRSYAKVRIDVIISISRLEDIIEY